MIGLTGMRRGWIGRPLVALALSCATADAAVVESTPAGFAIEYKVHLAATPEQVYQALIHPAQWWNPDHTYSHDAGNLTLDPIAGGCFCEEWHGGSVQHARVVNAQPGKILRLMGPLGPFQGEAVSSALTFNLKAESDGTTLTLTDNAGGYMRGGFGKWPHAADAMMGDLVMHLKNYVEKPAALPAEKNLR